MLKMKLPLSSSIKHLIRLIAVYAVFVTSCTDDLQIPDDVVIGEGTSTVSASVEFEPLAAALDKSRGTAGDAIKYIEDLTLFIYDSEGHIYRIMNTPDFTNWDIQKDVAVTMPSGSKVDGSDQANQSQAEKTTCKATFNMQLPYGKYLIYAVANMGSFPTDEESLKAYRTPDLLKGKTVEWQSDVKKNNQMFGYMTLSGSDHETSAGFDPTPVTINKKNISLHSWLKRAASKVTIVYDGSNLKNGIQIYIKSVTIKDIPRYCKIGENNTISDAESLISVGESIYYDANGMLGTDATGNDDNFRNWMIVNKGNGPQGAVTRDENGQVTTHSETDQALYFYENLQGNYPGQKQYYKRQIWEEVGENITKPDQPDYKDNIKYGTYIEVEAYYSAVMEDYVSNGPIKYRFMLGQDVEYNYNAYRNHHYKLTLGFNGYANQPDWHIEYVEEDPYIATPPIFYVPYTYYQKSMFPIRLIGNCVELTAEIIENNWAPYDPDVQAGEDSVPPQLVGPANDPLSFRWARMVYEGTVPLNSGITYNKQKPWSSDGKTQLSKGTEVTPIWAGFLALRVPSQYENESSSMPATLFPNSTHNYSKENEKKDLKDYYYNNQQNIRTFTKTDLSTTGTVGSGRNQCVVTKGDDGSVTVSLPMWTRAKNLLGISGFSGNNPYDTYQRKAVVKYTAVFEKSDGSKETLTREIPVYQVRRIVNPKGVWRKSTDNTSFNVVLCRRENPEPTTDFTSFVSEGAWRATITTLSENAEGFISLSGGDRTEQGGVVHGNQGTPIDFNINFNNKTTPGTTNCAIVRVEYHGYTCVHNIFVRQGYLTPIKVVGDAEWSSFNLYSCDLKTSWDERPNWDIPSDEIIDATLTQSPLALGTFFKRANLIDGILVKNNDRSGFGPLEPIGDNQLYVTSGGSKKWSDIKGLAYANRSNAQLDDFHKKYTWPNFKAVVKINESTDEERYYTVPTYEQYRELELGADYGVGVLYADGATSTALKVSDAYGFKDGDNTGNGSKNGMRGIIVYNNANANQIFFPLGANGIGRRTVAPLGSSMTTNMMGYLRYGALTTQIDMNVRANTDRPIPYNLTASPGAIYWIKTSTLNDKSEPNRLGWDMNYFDLNFNSYDYAVGFENGGDALPIKLVRIPKP